MGRRFFDGVQTDRVDRLRDELLDLWFEQDVKPRLRRAAYLIRYADDFVIGFSDAQRVMDVVPKRFGKYGLTVHPTKTKLVPFRPPSSVFDGSERHTSRASWYV